MNTSRRSFLRASSFAGIAAAIAALLPQLAFGKLKTSRTGYWSLPKDVYDSPLYNLSHRNFYSQIGTVFAVQQATRIKHGLRLVEVADLRPMWGKDRPESKECFSLTFVGSASRPLQQGTYSLLHSELGPFDLFIVPTDEKDPRGLVYEANINRLFP
jgi:Domain of unknown function (DUF6916)